MHREKVYFSTKFCHFCVDHIKNQFLLKQIYRHVRRIWTCTQNNFISIFNIFKYIKNTFQIKGAYGPESKKKPLPILAWNPDKKAKLSSHSQQRHVNNVHVCTSAYEISLTAPDLGLKV
jgi:hypothetical protein